MNDLFETLRPPFSEPRPVRNILDSPGLKAAVVTLEPGEEIELPLEPAAQVHLLCVTQGCATIRVDELNHVLNLEQALQLTRHEPIGIWNHGSGPAKLLRVDVHAPPPPPPLIRMTPA